MDVDGALVKPSGSEFVPAVTLDSYAVAKGIDRIDLLKLDVEGAEMEALLGGANLLTQRRIRCILFEISLPMIRGMNRDPMEIFHFFQVRGYAVYRLSADLTLKIISSYEGRIKENFIAMPADFIPEHLLR
jgi:hypothetical protein